MSLVFNRLKRVRTALLAIRSGRDKGRATVGDGAGATYRPGKDVDISIAGNSLTIKGETKHEEEKEEKGRYHFRERRYGAFQRTVSLPVDVNADKAKAAFENGVLKLSLPKVEEAKPKRITIKAN